MIVQMRPLFSEGYILRQEMLAALSDQAFSLGELMVTGFGDGFLTGCNLSTTKEIIQMGPGAILFGGKLCLLTESLSIAYYPTDTLRICKLRFSEEYQSNTCVYREADMVLTDSDTPNNNELEVCRFKLQPGAQLRYKYDDFEDRSTEYDTLNTICAPFSAHIGSSLAPELLRVYARELLEANPTDPLDKEFCLQALSSHTALSKEVLVTYIRLRTGNNELGVSCSNAEIYDALLKLLKNIRQGMDPSHQRAKRRQWKLDVD